MRDEKGEVYTDLLGKKWWLDNFLKSNFDFIKPKVSHKTPHRRSDLFIIIDGPVGSGKTTLSFQCARYFDPTFDLSRVVFGVDDFLKVLVNATPGQAVVFDEAIIVNSRSALTEFNKKVIIAMTQIRSKGLYIFFNIPSLFDLDRNLVLNRCHLLLHCYQDHFGDRGKYCVFDKDKMKFLYLKGKRLYSYAMPKANFVAKFTEYFYLDRIEYEKKKSLEIGKQAKRKGVDMWKRRFVLFIRKFIKHPPENWNETKIVERIKFLAELSEDLDESGLSEIYYRDNVGETVTRLQ